MEEGQLAIIWLLLSTLALFAMIFGLRYIANKENMAMIEKGLNPRQYASRPAPFRSLKWGLLLLGAGAGLVLAFIIDSTMIPDEQEPVAIYFGLIAIGGGLGLIGSYSVEKKHWMNKNGNESSM
jgi:hypothetical protein